MMKNTILLIMIFVLFIASFGVCEDKVEDGNEAGFTYNDHGKRNPFWELIDSGGNIINYGGDIMLSDMVLEGIMLGNKDNNIAIINGKVLQKNDKIGDFVVLDIQTDAVFLIKNDKKFELHIKKED